MHNCGIPRHYTTIDHDCYGGFVGPHAMLCGNAVVAWLTQKRSIARTEDNVKVRKESLGSWTEETKRVDQQDRMNTAIWWNIRNFELFNRRVTKWLRALLNICTTFLFLSSRPQSSLISFDGDKTRAFAFSLRVEHQNRQAISSLVFWRLFIIFTFSPSFSNIFYIIIFSSIWFLINII